MSSQEASPDGEFIACRPSAPIALRLSSIHAYALRGLTLENASGMKHSRVARFGGNCRALVSDSINEACRLLAGATFTGHHGNWLCERHAEPPFLVILLRDNGYEVLHGHYDSQGPGQYICAQNHRGDANPDTLAWEKARLGRIVTALTAALSTGGTKIDVTPLGKTVFGTTREGKSVFDIKIGGGRQKNHVLNEVGAKEINAALSESQALFSTLSGDTGAVFYETLGEPDRLKRFLGYFLFIERATHRTFRSLDLDEHVPRVFNMQERIRGTSAAFGKRILLECKSVTKRFHLCAMLVWKDLDDEDVADFLAIKKVRDALAHGHRIEESGLPVEQARALAMKLVKAGTT